MTHAFAATLQPLGKKTRIYSLPELAKRGYDPVYGARPLKRTIQKELQDPLARAILEGRVKDGDKITVTFDGNDFLINGASERRAA